MNSKQIPTRSRHDIPPLIEQILELYGREVHDGQGGVIVYLDKRGRREVDHDLGSRATAKLDQWLHAYKVRSASDGHALAVGYKLRRAPRP